MKRLTLLVLILTAAACSNYDPTGPYGRQGAGWGGWSTGPAPVKRQFVVGGVVTLGGRVPDSVRIYLPAASATVTHWTLEDSVYQLIGWVKTSTSCQGLRALAEAFPEEGGAPLATAEGTLSDCPANVIDFRLD